MVTTSTAGAPSAGGKTSISSRSTWAQALLALINAPATQQNINTIVAWETAEGGAGPQFGVKNNIANYNPLNVTLTTGPLGYGYDPGTGTYYQGATPTPGNTPPVASLTSWVEGLDVTAARLKQPFAAGILQALQSNESEAQVAQAVGASGWGTGDFASVTAKDTAVTTSSLTSNDPTVIGIPNEMPQNPSLGGASILNPFGALSAQVQWLGEWIGWAFFITIIFVLGAAIMLLGFVMLLSILLGPAVGPVMAGVGKGPSGWVLGAVKDIGANREDGQTRNARRQLASQGGSNRRSDYVAAQRSAPGPGRTRPLRPSGGSTSSDF